MYGTTVEVLKHNMNQTDPSKIDMENKAVKAAMEMQEVSETRSRLLICAVKVRNCMAGMSGKCLQGCLHIPPPEWTKKKWTVPLNGPRLAKLLFDVHGHQMFRNGLFNSDPHAGNVMMMLDGRLGLLDFGASQRLTEEQRTNIALLLVAVADEDDAAVPQAFWDCGFRSERQDPRLALLLAHVFFNRGPWPYDMNRLAPTIGMPQDVDIVTLDSYIRGGQLDDIKEFPGHLVMLQRCCMVLSGIGMELGAGRLSSAGMLKPQALQLLRGKGLVPLQ
jgi:aarF domain-containing kinase